MRKLIYPLLFVCLTVVSCTNNQNPSTDTAKKNAEMTQSFYDKVMNARDVSQIDNYVADNFVDHQPFPGYPAGKEGLKAGMTDFFAAYPDLSMKTKFIHTFGDTVVAHVVMSGTQTGPFMGMPATNKKFEVEGVDILVIKDGKATEHWGYFEEMKMMEQLGMMGGEAHEGSQPAK